MKKTITLFILSVLSLAGCQHIEVVEPDRPALSNVFDTQEIKQWPVKWWESFNDPQLNQYVSQALAENYNLKAALARVEQSAALWQNQRSRFIPDVSVNLGRSRTRASQSIQDSDVWSAGVAASYEVDIWGRIGALTDQAAFNQQASEYAYRALTNTVSAEISTAWLGLRRQAETIALLKKQQKRTDTSLQIISLRQSKGQANLSDVLQQKQLQESIHTQMIAAEAQAETYRQQLALWLSKGTVDVDLPADAKLPAIEAVTPTIPLEVIRVRPDVQQAFYQLQSANAGVAAAVANRYPRFSLSASYTGQDRSLKNVMDNWVSSLAGSLVLPMIDGGQRRSEVARQRALVEENLANYKQTVISAALDVEQALVLNDQFLQTEVSLAKQLQFSRDALSRLNKYYAYGNINYIALLNAQQGVLNLEQQLLNARWNKVVARILLYRTVSHGFFGDESL